MPRPLLYCITVAIGLIWINRAPAQSLYHETQELKRILDARNVPTIYASDGLQGWEATFESKKLKVTDSLKLGQIGQYTLKRKRPSFDSLFIKYGKSGSQIAVPNSIRIDNMPNAVAWTLYSETTRLPGSGAVTLSKSDSLPWVIQQNMETLHPGADPSTFTIDTPGKYMVRASDTLELNFNDSIYTIDIPESFRLLIELTESDLSFYQVSAFQIGKISKPDFYDLMTLLAVHSEYKEERFGFNTLENVYKKYADNPFLKPLLDTLLYSYKFEEIAPFLDFDEKLFEEKIQAQLANHYPWLRAMYQDPTLDNKKQVLQEKDVHYYANLDPNTKSSSQLLQNASQRANSAYTKVSGFDQTSIIVGLSDFIAERAQEELNITFMNRFKNRLTTSEPNEFSVLFPNTYDLFLQFEIANYKKLLQNARPVFANDLQNLGLHLPHLLKLDKYKDLLNYSTEVYNLALFYEVTRMVYNERPIEDILVTSFQQMRRRSLEMGEIINLTLADTLMKATVVSADTSKNKLASRQLLRNTFDQLRPKVINYNSEIEKNYLALRDANLFLRDFLSDLEAQVDPKASPQLASRVEELQDRLGRESGIYSARFDYPVPLLDVPKKAYDYYTHYAGNNLDGKGYFGYYLEGRSGSFKDYDTYFSSNLSEKAYVARGVELTRLLVEERFDSTLTDWRTLLSAITPEARMIQEQVILRRRAKLDTLINQVRSLRAAVESGLTDEVTFWASKKMSDSTNVDLAGLTYLKKLIDPGVEVMWDQLFTFGDALQDPDPTTVQQLMADPAFADIDFSQLRVKADHELSRIFREAKRRIASLEKENPRIKRPKNQGFQQYENIRRKAVSFSPTEFVKLNNADSLIRLSQLQMTQIDQHKTDLEKKLSQLDDKFVPRNLVKARSTSQDLATASELCVHLLYSLKRSVVKDFQPMIRDTSEVEYTIMHRDDAGQVDSSSVISRQLIEPGKTGAIRSQTNWLKKESFDSVMLNAQARAIFLGLLYEQLKALKSGPALSADGLATLTTKLINTVYSIESDRDALDYKKLTGKKITFKDYYPFIQTTVDLFSTVVETPVYKDSSMAQRKPGLDAITKVAQQGLSLYNNIDKQQYGYAIYNAMEIFRVIAEAESNKKESEGKKVSRGDRVRNAVILYGTFMADVVNARSSDQVKEALRAAASPPGSSRLKRELVYNMAVNSYIGPGFGIERLRRPPAGSNQNSGTIGLSVPVGLSFSWKWDKTDKNSFSLFVPVLDIGAVTYFRLNDKNADNLPELNFNNFIAPGAFLFYNINNSPFTFGGGWQYGPQIRGTSLTDPNLSSSASRFLLFAGIDVPLFNLANGPQGYPDKRKKNKKGKKTSGKK